MLQCVYMASVLNDLLEYKSRLANQLDDGASNQSFTFTVGIIGCGQVGTMILTKLLEARSAFSNLNIVVSTRQPHLLRPFKEQFGITTEFNNEKVVYESDIVFVCVLPG